MMNKKAINISDQTPWHEMTIACEIYEGGTSKLVNTGDWRTKLPSFDEERCKHCMLCIPVCPDNSIPIKNGKRLDFDYMHCKGCGICYKVCPFNAISFSKEEK